MVCDLPYLTEKRAKNMEFNVLYIALERQTVMHEKELQEKQREDMESQFKKIAMFMPKK